MPSGLSTKLHPPALEAEFREAGIARERKVVTILTGIVIFFQLTSLLTDRALLADSPYLPTVLGVRAVGVAVTLLALLLVRRRAGISAFDQTVFLWTLATLAGVTVANALLPATYVEYVAWDLLIALGIYTVFPLPLARQIAAASLFTLAGALVLYQFKTLEHPGGLLDILIAYLCANGVGIFASWELSRGRRRQFLLFRAEAQARERLEIALAEIRTLRGIIPICALCKQVRTEIGEWRQVEAYVRDHSEADFSHSICPSCEKTLYADFLEEGEDPQGGAPHR